MGKLAFWLYGFRPGAQAWETFYSNQFEELSFSRGVGCGVAWGCSVLVRADDFMIVEKDEHLDWIQGLIEGWFEDVADIVSNNIESYKKNYETLDDFKNLVENELSELLSDVSKNRFIQKLEINDKLDIKKSLEELFYNNENQDIDNFWNLARGSALSFIDQSWKDHLAEMDYLRSGIGLRAMGQRDPLVEYQNEGYDLFEELIDNVKFSVIRILLNFDKNLIVKKEKNIDDNVKEKTITKDKIGRNDPCYCGSGKKYKKCGMVDACIKKS